VRNSHEIATKELTVSIAITAKSPRDRFVITARLLQDRYTIVTQSSLRNTANPREIVFAIALQ
jgi:hypothetical protein